MALNYGHNSRRIIFGTTSKGPAGPQGPKGAKGVTGSSGPVGGISSISSDLSLGNNRITDLGTPSDDTDASTKEYVDNQIQTKIGHDGSTSMSSDLDMGDNRIVNLEDPTSGSDAATKMYVDQEAAVVKAATDMYTMLEVGKKVSLDGSTAMTGNLNLGSNRIMSLAHPSLGLDGANKKYVDDKVNAGFVNGNNYTNGLIGGVLDLGGSRAMTGNLDAGGSKIVSLGTPTADTDAATKKYVDDNGGSSSGAHTGSGLNMNLKKITNLGAPTSSKDATTKGYVDGEVNQSLTNSDAYTDKQILQVLDLGGTRAMTGNLDMGSNRISKMVDPSSPLDAANKKYVDAEINAGFTAGNSYSNGLFGATLDLTGTRYMVGNINMSGNKIVDLGAPTVDTDASNKKSTSTTPWQVGPYWRRTAV